MVAIVSLLLVLSLSILITRIATLALTHTGLSRQTAKFQAKSAFTGVGFTTSESEKVVNHPVRRRILLFIMLIGNAGIVTVIATFILGFVEANRTGSVLLRVGMLAAGVTVLMSLAGSRWVDRRLSTWILRLLKKYTRMNVVDYASILHLAGEYSINELYIEEKDWMAGQTLMDLKLKDEGILVLGVTRKDGSFTGTPDGSTRIHPKDTLILYGRGDLVARLDRRRKGVGGNLAHAEAVREQEAVKEEEKRKAGEDAFRGRESET